MHRNINKVKLICKGNMRRSLFLSTMGTFLFAFNCDRGMNDFRAKAIQNRLYPDLKLLNNPSADYFSCSSSIKEEQDRETVYNSAIQQVADSNPSKMTAAVVAATDGLEYPRIISQKKSDNDIGLLVDDTMDCKWGDSDLSGSFIKVYQDNSAVQQVADSNSSKMSQTVVAITDGLENSIKISQKKADNEIALLVDDNTDLEWDDSGFNDSFSGVKNLEWDNSDFSGSLCENEIIVESDDSNDSILKALDKPSDLFI